MVYFGQYGKTHLYKFGETSRTNPNERRKEIRKVSHDKSFDFVRIMNDNTTKAEDLFIESYIRMEFAHNGYTILGNDHIKGNKDMIAMFESFYMQALSMIRR